MANSLISMIKGDSTLIDNTEVLDGQVLFDTTNQKILLDSGTERREYGGSADNALKKVNVAYIEPTMVTTRGYSAGTYIMVQDTLYKTTTQVNSGTTLVVGTNVSVVTVGGELTQINNDLSVFSFRNNNGTAQYSMDDGSTWTNFKNPVGTKNIYSNGTYDVTNYASAYVSVSTVSRTLLWTNPDPTANYTGQSYVTSNHDIRNYDAIMVKYYGHKDLGTSSDNVAYSLFMSPSQLQEPSTGKDYKYCLLGFRGSTTKYARRVYLGRDFSDGIHIYISYANAIDAAGTSAGACIPIAIYGVNGLGGIK